MVPLPTCSPFWLPIVLSINSTLPVLDSDHPPDAHMLLPLPIGLTELPSFPRIAPTFSSVQAPLQTVQGGADTDSWGTLPRLSKGPSYMTTHVACPCVWLPHHLGAPGREAVRSAHHPLTLPPPQLRWAKCEQALDVWVWKGRGKKALDSAEWGASTSLLPGPCIPTGRRGHVVRGNSCRHSPKVRVGTVRLGRGLAGSEAASRWEEGPNRCRG